MGKRSIGPEVLYLLLEPAFRDIGRLVKVLRIALEVNVPTCASLHIVLISSCLSEELKWPHYFS